MLNCRMTVTKIAEVVDITGGKKSTGGKGMNGRIAPLETKINRLVSDQLFEVFH